MMIKLAMKTEEAVPWCRLVVVEPNFPENELDS